MGFKEVSDALAGRSTLGEQAQAQAAQTAAERRRFELADLRYRNGVASYLDLLDAQRSLFALEQADVQTRLLQQINQISSIKPWAAAGTPPPPPTPAATIHHKAKQRRGDARAAHQALAVYGGHGTT